MKRDLELIKRMLIRLDELEDDSNDEYRYEDFGFDSVSEKNFYYHTKIMAREELIAANEEAYISYDYPLYIPLHVLPKGAEFLRAANDETVWAKLISFAGEAGKNFTLTALTAKGLEFLSALLSS